MNVVFVDRPTNLRMDAYARGGMKWYFQESVHASVKGGMKYNTGRLLMVLHKPLIPQRGEEGYESGPRYGEPEDMDGQMQMLPMP